MISAPAAGSPATPESETSTAPSAKTTSAKTTTTSKPSAPTPKAKTPEWSQRATQDVLRLRTDQGKPTLCVVSNYLSDFEITIPSLQRFPQAEEMR